MSTFVKAWGPVFLWFALIFFFSTDTFSSENTSRITNSFILWIFPDASAGLLKTLDRFTRTVAHWSEYFILALLLIRAFRIQTNRWPRRWLGWTFAIVSVYALGDEFHQIFVASRDPAWTDVMLDIFGGACGVFWMYLRESKYRG
ncbi:MAG TPA: VanZ family protein [Candidatus Binatia bacterium]|jgi:VanZ family protein|nr:VanZ family protein [Candidatus Binatia bacterium]